MKTLTAPNERTIAEAMAGMDSGTRNAFQEALEKRRDESSQVNYENQGQADAIMEAEKESKLADILPKLYPLWDRMERRKDQKNDLTLKEYQNITGKQYPAHIIKDKQGREYVSWDNAIDNIAAEYGYETPEALYNDLEKLVIARQGAEDYQEIAKMAATDVNNAERSIKILARVKEGKYAIKESDEESAKSTPESSQSIPVNQQTGKQGTADTSGSGTARQIKTATENSAVNEVKEMFDKAEATGAIVRTTSGHWKQVDGTWKFFRDINPGVKLKGLSPTTSRMSMYLSAVKPSAVHHAIPKATKPHVIPQHRTKDGRGLTRRSDR